MAHGRVGMMLEMSPRRAARGLTYLSVSVFFAWLLATGKLHAIVHPRMTPWIAAAGLLFLVLAIYEALRPSSRSHSPDPLSFFYPFAYILAIAYIFVQAVTLQPGRLQTGPETLAMQSSSAGGEAGGAAAGQAAGETPAADKAAAPLPSWIAPTDDDYWTLYNRLYDDPAAALGRRITVQGFVYREARFPPGSTLIGRNLMWCCSADMAIIGYFARSPSLDEIHDSSWVEVTGRLRTVGFDMDGSGTETPVPLIAVESVRSVERSASPTIFPR